MILEHPLHTLYIFFLHVIATATEKIRNVLFVLQNCTQTIKF